MSLKDTAQEALEIILKEFEKPGFQEGWNYRKRRVNERIEKLVRFPNSNDNELQRRKEEMESITEIEDKLGSYKSLLNVKNK